LCSERIVLENRADEATALTRKAVEALEAEAQERRSQCERALGRAEAHRRKKRYDDAMRELERARGFDPTATELQAFEDRLKASMAESEHETELARQVADAIAAARLAFSSGERDRALADLRSFHARAPARTVTAEISRLEAEATRIAAVEQRAAEAEAHATAAEAALAAGNPQHALELARLAIAIDPGHPLACKVSGLAGAEMKQQADARVRAATAARHIEDAKQQIARGRFQKARALASAAADLNPADDEHKVVLARIEEEEARVTAEAERERLARQRAKAVAPILEHARAAEGEGDYVRAAWTAENALAIDLDCAEAMEILRRAKAQLDAQPALAEETVDLTSDTGRSGDPDDTVTLTRPIGLWQRVTSAFKSWVGARHDGGGMAAAEGGVQQEGAEVRGHETAESKPAKTPVR
jgi:tetratricopeptide (TPR) repeat protein